MNSASASSAFASLKTRFSKIEKPTSIETSIKTTNVVTDHKGRRGLLLLSAITAAATTQASDSRTLLLNKYLKKSEENKAKNDKERLDDYYKRNYKDYFGLLEGNLQQKKDLSESEKGILQWLEKNK